MLSIPRYGLCQNKGILIVDFFQHCTVLEYYPGTVHVSTRVWVLQYHMAHTGIAMSTWTAVYRYTGSSYGCNSTHSIHVVSQRVLCKTHGHVLEDTWTRVHLNTFTCTGTGTFMHACARVRMCLRVPVRVVNTYIA